MNTWKFVEDAVHSPWAGGIPVQGTEFLPGQNAFFIQHNPTQVSESNTSTIKELQTVDGENLRVNTYRPGDNKRTTKYDIKLEFQSTATYKNLKFLFNNGFKFYLYKADPLVNTSTELEQSKLWLMIDDLNVDWVALQGNKQVYGISLKCTDMATDSSGNPIQWAFKENSRSPWDWAAFSSFLTDHAPTSANETFKKKGTDVETINGKTVRINPIRIKADGSVEKVPGTKNLNIKLDYQSETVKERILSLYNNANEFDLYAESTMSSGAHLGLFVIDDYNIEYSSVRGTTRLYGISILLREVEV